MNVLLRFRWSCLLLAGSSPVFWMIFALVSTSCGVTEYFCMPSMCPRRTISRSTASAERAAQTGTELIRFSSLASVFLIWEERCENA